MTGETGKAISPLVVRTTNIRVAAAKLLCTAC